MASKGQKFLKYTEEEKNEIIQRYLKGESGYQLAKQYGISVNTIKTWKYKINHPEKITYKKRGRPKEQGCISILYWFSWYRQTDVFSHISIKIQLLELYLVM